jgi:hypothetical protein
MTGVINENPTPARRNGRWIVAAFVLLAFAIAALIITAAFARNRARAAVCAKTISSICLAARIYGDDNGGRYPEHLAQLSNEIGSLYILICPADKTRTPAVSWAELGETNSSYVILAPGARDHETNRPFLQCIYHGHVVRVDGLVIPGPQRRPKK